MVSTLMRLRETRAVTGLALAAIATICGAVALGGDEAEAGSLSCGDTINTDVTLHADLVNCPSNGLVIGADGVTLDLNGHAIEGDGAAAPDCDIKTEFCDLGVVTQGHDGVRIKRGEISGFINAVVVFGGRGVRVHHITALDSLFAGIAAGARNVRLRENKVRRAGLTTDQAGMVVFGSEGARVLANRVRNSGDIGIAVLGHRRGIIRANVLRRNPEAGILIDDSNRLSVRHNRVTESAEGMIISGNGNRIAGNRISKPNDCGPPCGNGISLDDGKDNRISRNLVVGARSEGIQVGIPHRYARKHGPLARHTSVLGNRLRRSKGDGLVVRSNAYHTLLARNRARRSKHDGFRLHASGVRLRRNVAVRNGDLGIDAPPGVENLGGNVARRNGDPAQCVNVHCRRR